MATRVCEELGGNFWNERTHGCDYLIRVKPCRYATLKLDPRSVSGSCSSVNCIPLSAIKQVFLLSEYAIERLDMSCTNHPLGKQTTRVDKSDIFNKQVDSGLM